MKSENTITGVYDEGDSPLTPADCYSTRFKQVRWGGYSRSEVDAFVARAADALESLQQTAAGQSAELEQLRAAQAAHQEMEHALREALVAAQKSAELTLEQARREAANLVEEARLSKLRLEQEGTRIPFALRREIEELSTLRSRLRRDLRTLLDTHAAFLDEIVLAETRDVRMPGDTDHDLPVQPPRETPQPDGSTAELPADARPSMGLALDDPAWLSQSDAITDDKDILE